MPDDLIRRAGHVLRPDPKYHPADQAFRCDGCGGDLEGLRRLHWPPCPHPADPAPAEPEAWDVLDWGGDIAAYWDAGADSIVRLSVPHPAWVPCGPWRPLSVDPSGCTNVAFCRPLRRKE
jgi:hypothetical protein